MKNENHNKSVLENILHALSGAVKSLHSKVEEMNFSLNELKSTQVLQSEKLEALQAGLSALSAQVSLTQEAFPLEGLASNLETEIKPVRAKKKRR